MFRFLFLLLVLPATVLAQRSETIQFYQNKYKSIDIIGFSGGWGPSPGVGGHITEKLTPVPVSTRFGLLGGQYDKNDMASTSPLLNMNSSELSPILDSINFRFYKAYGFSKLYNKNPLFKQGGSKRAKLKEFEKQFVQATLSQKKELLNDLDDDEMKEAIENSRYDTINPRKMDLSVDLQRDLTFSLTASIIADLKKDKSLNLTADFIAALTDSLSKTTKSENGLYEEIRLDPNYLTLAKMNLAQYEKDPSKLNTSDVFSYAFAEYLENGCAAIVTAAATFYVNFEFTSERSVSQSISLTLSTKLGIGKEKADSLAGKLVAKFMRIKKTSLNVEAPSSYYYIRYAYNDALELGEKKCR